MKQKILNKAGEMFLNFGFKSVTMDEIASGIGVSKKTIYTHYKNKTTLVEEVTNCLFDSVCEGINLIHTQEENPIKELFEVKHFVMNFLKDEKNSPQYQLQKYYPKIYESIKDRQFEFTQECIKETLERGIDQGLFRDNLDVEFIFRIYFYGINIIKDQELFPVKEFNQNDLMDNYLEYHLRGICTNKGIEILENQLKEN